MNAPSSPTPVLPEPPLISVIMANYNGAAHVAAAVRSVFRQTLTSLELIFSDDCSADDSIARARAAAGGDPRLVIVESARRSGPAAARNRALQHARGRWIAIIDSDDFMHPVRFAELIARAERDGADIAADDQLVFYEDGGRAPHGLLFGARAQAPSWIDAAAFVAGNGAEANSPALGRLKPVLRRALLPTPAYDESLIIAEDYDLIFRLLQGGAKMRIYPELWYFYRKHSASVSHRSRTSDLERMLAAHKGNEASVSDPSVLGALRRRRASLIEALNFSRLVDAIKARRPLEALPILARRPWLAWGLRDALFNRLRPPAAKPAPRTQKRVVILSRQRVVGATSGSAAYLLALVRALGEAGFLVDFIGASPKVFGRWPVLRLRPEMKAFDKLRFRGGARLGDWIWALDPRVYGAGMLAGLQSALIKLGLPSPGWSRPAEYAVTAAPTRADALYIARKAGAGADAVLCDYAPLAPLAPYALSPQAPTIVIMHDLLSAHVANLAAASLAPPHFALNSDEEFALLAQADAIAAIQPEEQALVRAALPRRVDVLLTPHPAVAAPAPQPGQDDCILFVGSNTAPNLQGVSWFLRECWPLVRARQPSARLVIVGSVCRALSALPKGVEARGLVNDLAPLYAEAGVVISPLHAGSGLKIKLVEALAAGKAVVGTPMTARGVADLVEHAMVIEERPAAFAAALCDLLEAPAQRRRLGQAALACVERNFSAAACCQSLIECVATGGAAHKVELVAIA